MNYKLAQTVETSKKRHARATLLQTITTRPLKFAYIEKQAYRNMHVDDMVNL